MRNENGFVGGFLILLLLVFAALGFVWYQYPGGQDLLRGLVSEKKEHRGYMTYEEYQKKKAQEKALADFKEKFSSWFDKK